MSIGPKTTSAPDGVSAAVAASIGVDEAADVRMVARGGIANLVGAMATGVFQFALVVIVARTLYRAQSGAFFEAVALFAILSNTCELGADTGLTRFIPRYRVDGRVADIRRGIGIAVWPAVASGVIFGALAVIFAHPLAEVFTNHRAGDVGMVTTYVRVLALFLPLACCYTVVIAGTRGFGTMMPNALIDRCMRPVLQCVLVGLVLVFTTGPAWISAGWGIPYAIGLVAGVLWLGVLVRRTERQAAGHPVAPPTEPRKLAREFWMFTAPRGLTGAFQVSILWVGPLLVGSLLSTPDASVYTASTRYLVAGSLVNTAIIQVIAPKLSELLAAGLADRARSIYRVATAWLVMLAWPMYLTFAVWAPVMLRAFGHRFAGGEGTLEVLAITMLFATAIGPIDMVLLMGGRSSLNLLNVVIALVLNVVIGFLLIPSLGIVGAAFGLAAAILFNNVAPLFEVRSFIKIDPLGPAFVPVTAASLGCFGVIGVAARFTLGESIPVFLASLVVSTILYLLLLVHYRERLELVVLLQTIKRKSGRRSRGSLDPKPLA